MQAIVLTSDQLQNLMFHAGPLQNLVSGQDAQDGLMNMRLNKHIFDNDRVYRPAHAIAHLMNMYTMNGMNDRVSYQQSHVWV
jgi:hypothetical protein